VRNGLLAEFESPEALVAAARRLRASGYTALDAFTPFQVPEVEEAIGVRRSWIPRAVLVAAVVSAALAYFAQWWMNAFDWPLNVGGRPIHSGPAYIPVTFEMAVLGGGLCALLALAIATGLPRFWSPLFEVEGFERASIDRFFLGVDLGDPRFEPSQLEPLLHEAGAVRVVPVGVIR
jgi:hypothetical protein